MTDESTSALIARIDERTGHMDVGLQELRSLMADMDKRFVTRAEYEPLRKIIYGMAGTVMLMVVGALGKLVIVG